MTLQTTKLIQMRLDSCAFERHKWPKINEKIEKRACVTVKISDLVAKTAARVEITRENGKGHRNISLLGKYPFIQAPWTCVV